MCGVGVAMIAVATGKQEKTVERWMRQIAPHCKRLIEQNLSKQNHGFTSVYLQMSAKALVEAIKARIHGAPGLITTDGLEAYTEKINRPYMNLGRDASLSSGLFSLSQSHVEDRRKV